MFFSFVVSATNAQQSKDSIRQLREVIVEARAKAMKHDSMPANLKTPLSIMELPQHITAISAELLNEQGGFELKDAVRNVSGMYFGLNNSVFDGASNLYVRGFSGSAIYRNGLPSGSTYGGSQDDAALIERIDFVKGAAGFLNSAGDAGGAINITTKTPRSILQATFTGGSYNFYRAAIDAGTAQKDQGFSFRFNGVYNYQEYFLDMIGKRKIVIAPVIQYNISPKTYILAEYNLIDQKVKNGTQFTKVEKDSMVMKDRQSANYMADPGLPDSYSREQTGRLVISHQFSDQWKITSQSSYKTAPSEMWSFLGASNFNAVTFNANDSVQRLSYTIVNNRRAAGTQLFVNGNFSTGKFIRHQLLAGVDYFHTKDSSEQRMGTQRFPFTRMGLEYGLNTDSLRDQTVYTYNNSNNNWMAGYVYNTVTIGRHLVVMLGGRYMQVKRTSNNKTAPANARLIQSAFTPRLGITALIDRYTAIYALYDQTFVPQSGQDFEKREFEPLRGDDLEAGIKRDWWKGKFSTSASVFLIHRNNMLTTDLEHPGNSIQIGQVKSKGIEFDALGMIGPYIAISANYALIDAKISRDASRPQRVGQRYSIAPEQQINSWVRFSFPESWVKGLSLSVGQITAARRGTTTAGLYFPDYTKFDGSITYERGKVTTRLLLDNLTNQRYAATGDIFGGNWFYQEGAPLNFKIMMNIRLK